MKKMLLTPLNVLTGEVFILKVLNFQINGDEDFIEIF